MNDRNPSPPSPRPMLLAGVIVLFVVGGMVATGWWLWGASDAPRPVALKDPQRPSPAPAPVVVTPPAKDDSTPEPLARENPLNRPAPRPARGEDLPALPQVMPPPDFEAAFAREWARLSAIDAAMVAPLKEVTAPPGTVPSITEIEPGSQAERKKLKVGDLLVAVDGTEVGTEEQAGRLIRAGAKQVTLLGPDGARRDITLERERLGIQTKPYWRGMIAFQRAGGRSAAKDEPWLAEMTVAADRWKLDPPLALEALRRAVEKGCRLPLAAHLAVPLLAGQMRYEDALAYGYFARQQTPPNLLPGLTVDAILASAVGTFRYDLALEALAAMDARPGSYAGDLDAARQWLRDAAETYTAAGEGPVPNPAADAATREWLQHERLAALSPKEHARRIVKELSNPRGRAAFDVKAGSFIASHIGPAGSEVDFSTVVNFGPSKSQDTRWGRTFNIGLMDQSQIDALHNVGDLLFKFTLFHDGRRSMSNIGPGRWITTETTGAPLVGRDVPVRVVTSGRRVEILVDGQRAYYGYLPPDPKQRQLSVYLQFVGVKGHLADATYRTIAPDPATNRFPADQWVSVQPKSAEDLEKDDWLTIAGNWAVDADGSLVGTSDDEGLQLLYVPLYAHRFEMRAKVEVIGRRAPGAPPTTAPAPGANGGFIAAHAGEKEYYLTAIAPAEQKTLIRCGYGHSDQAAGPSASTAELLVTVRGGRMHISVDGKIVQNLYALNHGVGYVPVRVGLCSITDQPGQVVKFRDLQIRRLK